MRILSRAERQLPRGGRPKYPWNNWTDGEIHTATRGVDFTCGPASFVAGIHVKARQLEMKAETSTDGDTVTFLFKQDPNKPVVVIMDGEED